MSRPWISDLIGVIRGAQTVTNALIKHQEECIKFAIKTSNLPITAGKCLTNTRQAFNNIDPSKVPEKVVKEVREMAERVSVVEKGIEQFLKIKANENMGLPLEEYDPSTKPTKLHVFNPAKDPKEIPQDHFVQEKAEVGVQKKYTTVKEKIETLSNTEIPKIELSDKDKEILRRLELEHEQKIKNKKITEDGKQQTSPKTKPVESTTEAKSDTAQIRPKVKPSVRPKQTLSANAKPQKVPSTRFQRVVSFGTLGIGLGVGTVAEYTRRTLGLKEPNVGEALDSLFLSKANIERIVSTLCKVRGAALKLGQIISMQDEAVISPELQKAFERVRQSADFMPKWQVEKVLTKELGENWQTKLAMFEEKPFAAASIGQVHHATLLNGQDVAIKIQYPGVAQGIQSDIENLVAILKAWNIFPKGLFIDNLVEVAKKELAWEVDYVREAECTRKYRKLVQPYPEYLVPEVIDHLSTSQVFTTELIDGVPIDKCADMDMETKEHISKLIMQLCLKELFVFRYMQTDPNWSNFFYNPNTRQLVLLDFGACRGYEKPFMDKYIRVIYAASEGDRDTILSLSREMGFLTGYESKIMEEAHVDAVMVLGEVFNKNNMYYDFGGQDVTKRIHALVPTILDHRLCPPPEEIYSLHRKLSGVFLLCTKLRVKINCRDMFRDIYKNYKFG